MQQRPSKSELLSAISQFLLTDVYPAIPDKRLNFRVLIAANLANVVSTELEMEPEIAERELSRLRALLPDMSVDGEENDGTPKRRMDSTSRLLGRLNEELAVRLRSKQFDAQEVQKVWAHVKQTLIDTLGIVNPRFDTSPDIE